MRNIFQNKSKSKLTEKEKEKGAIKRQEIIQNAEAMKRLKTNPDFIRYCDILKIDRDKLNDSLLSHEGYGINSHEYRIRIIARINQLDRMMKKPKQLIWQMENLTEIRDAIKDKTHERQALGNKTGGENG